MKIVSLQKCAMLVLLLLSLGLVAHHPSYPAPLELVSLDSESAQDAATAPWVLITTVGFVSSEADNHLICREAFGVQGPLYAAVLGPNHFVVAGQQGLMVSLDGCHIDAEHTVDGWLVDVASRGDSLVATASSDQDGDILHWSSDGGLTLDDSLAIEEGFKITGLGWTDDHTLVATAFDDEHDELRGAARLVVVDISAPTPRAEIVEYAYPLRYPYLFAVDDQKVAVAARDSATPILLWGPLHKPDRRQVELETWPLFADFGVDGDIRVAPVDDDWRGAAVVTDEVLETEPRLSDQDVRCIVADAHHQWVCSSGVEELYELWLLDDGDDPLPVYRLNELEGPPSDCPDDSEVAQICPEYWELVEATIPSRPADEDTSPGDDDENDEGASGDDDNNGDGGDDKNEDGATDMPQWWEDAHSPSPDEEKAQEPDEDSPPSSMCQSISDGPLPPLVVLLAMLGALYLAREHQRSVSRRMDRRTPEPR